MKALVWAMTLLLACGAASAQVQISLPLEGYFRPGRYMPLRILADHRHNPGPLRVHADHAIPVAIEDSIQVDHFTLPLFILDSGLRNLRSNGDMPYSGPLIPLLPDQKLVGVMGESTAADGVFPGSKVITVRLDPADPLPGPPEAWESLDAILFDSAASHLSQKIPDLLANGTTLAVRSSDRPDQKWPWRRQGALWILDPALLGPISAGVSSDVFAPVQGWQAEWPWAFRRRIILFAALFSIAILAAALLKVRYAPIIALAVVVATVALLASWWKGRSAIQWLDGTLCVQSDRMEVLDRWAYAASPSSAKLNVPWSPGMRPYFEAFPDLDALAPVLICGADGQPDSFTFQLAPGIKLGVLTRQVRVAPPIENLDPAEGNPLLRLARNLYLSEGAHVAGQAPSDETWPWLIIRRPSPG